MDTDDDGDGFEDAADDCPTVVGTSTLGTEGCIDSDGDMWSDTTDDCPTEFGNSTEGGLNACPDMDGDGWADSIDDMPMDPTVWSDSDDDGDSEDDYDSDEDYDDEYDEEEEELLDLLGDEWEKKDLAQILNMFPTLLLFYLLLNLVLMKKSSISGNQL